MAHRLRNPDLEVSSYPTVLEICVRHRATKYQWCQVATMWTEEEQGAKPAPVNICLIQKIAYSG